MASTVTLGAWVESVRNRLEGPRQGPVNLLASPWTAGGTSLVFTYDLGGIAPGSILSIGQHTLLVVATNEGTKTATVIPAWAGSVDSNAGAGTVVRVNPRFTDFRIVEALNAALASLSTPENGLYAVGTADIDYTTGVEGYDLNAPNLLRVLEVRRQTSGVSLAWPRLRFGEWRLIENADTAVFPSGKAVRITCAEGGYQVRVTYASAFTSLSGLATLVSTSGIPQTAEDIPPLLAAVDLMSGREIARNDTSSQGNPRRADEVPAGAVGRSYGGLFAQAQRRITEEAGRLQAANPPGK